MASKMQTLVESGKLPVGTKLVRKVRGKITARAVVVEDGLKVGRKTYPSPSAAAHAITGGSVNGWTFWTAESGEAIGALR